jgi:hypothetical protein
MKRKPIDATDDTVQPPSEAGLDDYPATHPSTGTVDDDDDPADEQPGENEAEVGESRDDTEAPEEFERDDEDP